jgi:pilus assembly protein Flp/PilA
MKQWFNRFIREDEGQDLVEYALLIVFIALAVIAGMTALAGGINSEFTKISTSLQSS